MFWKDLESIPKSNKNNQDPTTAINYSIPSEEDIDSMIAQSMSMPMSF